MVRIATALVLAPGLWALLKLAQPPLFVVVALVVIGIAAAECYGMLAATGARPFKWLGVLATMGVASAFAGWYEVQLPFIIGGAVTLGLVMFTRADPREMLDTALHTVFPVLFVGLSFGFLIGLRFVPAEDGTDLLLLLFLCVILADTAAYYVGSAIGKHRLAPNLSPKKTWEGAVGGILGSTIGALLGHFWFYQRLPLGHALALGVVLGLAAIAGDMAESMVKRATGVKDSSKLLPGHGGILDRTDSLIFSGPILYYYYRFLLAP